MLCFKTTIRLLHQMKNIIKLIWISLIIQACSSENKPSIELSESETEQKLAAPQQDSIDSSQFIIHCNGRVEVPPQYRADVHARMAGYIERVEVLKGQRVKKGDLLAVISDQQLTRLQTDFLKSKASLENISADMRRKQELRSTEAVSEKSFQEIKSRYDAERANLKGLGDELRYIGLDPERINAENMSNQISIKSPIDGFVNVATPNVGRKISSDELLFQVIDETHKHVELELFADDASKVKIGQKVSFHISGSKDLHYGYVFLVNHAIDELSQTLNVHVHPMDEKANINQLQSINQQLKH
jgi:cobalt-zinc-cadmium efflux system membrane fusion protein